MESQSISVKRAQVEWHNFASLGEPERAYRIYAEENERRGAMVEQDADLIGEMSPFLEIGANAGHTSYMLANEFSSDGFALDISADALRHGIALQEAWRLRRAPVRVAGDALNLPFRDNSLRFVITCQTLSQFLNMDAVFAEVNRVLMPGGCFLFCEEPMLRMLSLRLYRCAYYDTMKPWERKLFDWGLLGYLVKDVIGAGQEEKFGIRQNHSLGLKQWQHVIGRHFIEERLHVYIPKRGWGERIAYDLAVRLDPHGSEWRAARLLGGTLAAVCRKRGAPPATPIPSFDTFERLLRCPDCRGDVTRDAQEGILCARCGYRAPDEGGVYNLIRSDEKKELYPGDREDVIDFSRPNHEAQLLDGWHELEGVFGNKFRWIGARATARLVRVRPTRQKLRIRGHAPELNAHGGEPMRIQLNVNGAKAGAWSLDRSGVFVLEAPLPDAADYLVELVCAPVWRPPDDDRDLTVNFSMLRLVDV